MNMLSKEKKDILESLFHDENLELRIFDSPLKAQIRNTTSNLRRFCIDKEAYNSMFVYFPSIEFGSKTLIPHFVGMPSIEHKEIITRKELVVDQTNLDSVILQVTKVRFLGSVYHNNRMTNTKIEASDDVDISFVTINEGCHIQASNCELIDVALNEKLRLSVANQIKFKIFVEDVYTKLMTDLQSIIDINNRVEVKSVLEILSKHNIELEKLPKTILVKSDDHELKIKFAKKHVKIHTK